MTIERSTDMPEHPRESDVRCARDSDWCDGVMCRLIGFNPDCPNADPVTIEQVAGARGCIGPFPCGRGAGANGRDLPCDCEYAANAPSQRSRDTPNGAS